MTRITGQEDAPKCNEAGKWDQAREWAPRSNRGGYHSSGCPISPGLRRFLWRLFEYHAILAVLSFKFGH